ncbi:hypothetical protein GCM10009039_07200 [Halocalculus aciditolerans]|uniref:Uncharacterized protein n=1 Tax=Halocalculus aciditolerans TaxID=1383812 RepID=A0A830F966_9EURY|nr:hypothetical protein GCM10009039_07200 [Halocalculus aciditolerans]
MLGFALALAVACLVPAAALAAVGVPVSVGFAVGAPLAAPVGAYAYAAAVHWVDTPRYWRDRGRLGVAADYVLVLVVGGAVTAAVVAVGLTVDAPWLGAIAGFPLVLGADVLVFVGLRGAYVDRPASETR